MLLLRPLMYVGTPARAKLALPLCDGHRIPDPEEFITDKSWRTIVSSMHANGSAIPNRERTRIDFEPMD